VCTFLDLITFETAECVGRSENL